MSTLNFWEIEARRELLNVLDALPPEFRILAGMARGFYSLYDKGLRMADDSFEEEALAALGAAADRPARTAGLAVEARPRDLKSALRKMSV